MSQFYLTLPSNSSMRYYPNNTVAHFTTKLPKFIDLEGEWEVALTELIHPMIDDPLKDGECYLELSGSHFSQLKLVLPSGYYDNASKIITEINNALLKAGYSENFALYENERIVFRSKIVMWITLSPLLCRMLGFSKEHYKPEYAYSVDEWGTFTFRAESPPDFRHFNVLFVYCDVVEPVVVGDVRAPLLRTVNLANTLHHEFVHPMYVPVQKRHFDNLEININLDTGEPAPFVDGKSVTILHFRRSSNPYLLLPR